ncbi:MAG TPA: hypothetical protein VFQ59_02055 [Candidatus Paceibacterota bacterium]|nr:hypothetical protein [Candidatus Paceibacterota bacterium]
MFGEEKKLKDTAGNTIKDTDSMPVSYDSSAPTSNVKIGTYRKSDKLVTALFMVTDILDKDEPIRGKLRSLATDLLSDIYAISSAYRTGNVSRTAIVLGTDTKISQIISFLEIASSIALISEMNASILKKEFFELKNALKDFTESETKVSWLEEFLIENPAENNPEILPEKNSFRALGNAVKNVHLPYQNPNGVRKTEISKKVIVSDKAPAHSSVKDTFDHLKRQRRDEILRIVKGSNTGSTITDIRTKATGVLASCGEKTLQRELVSMVGDGVLKKEGEKRWSRYSTR